VRAGKVVLALLSCLVLVAGCANVPEESQPEVITGQRLGQVNQDVPEPAKDLDVLSVVRDFVHASAQPMGNHAGARVYLDDAGRKNWQPDMGLTIIQDTFGTVYGTGDQQSADPNEQTVVLRGFNVGQLRADSAFIPVKGSYELPLKVHRQADGQWRIVNPPTSVVITQSDFTANYARVPLYFFAPDSSALVPDVRYVVTKPQSGLAGRVVDLLLAGPSDALVGAVRNPLGGQVSTEQNVKGTPDGALLVPLSGIGEQTDEARRLIAAQIVLSLQSVTTSRVRLLSDGTALVPGHEDWRPSDLPSYESLSSPSSELPGLMTVGGRVRSLGSGEPVPGPAGAGAYDVVSAAQSIDGRQLALVERAPDGRVQLRVGDYGREAQVVGLSGGTLTRPTWRPAPSAEGASGELWTVVDGVQVVRVLRGPGGRWVAQAVNAGEVAAVGPITALRLSRDGARAAVVAGGQLVVAAVVRSSDSVTLRAPRILQGGTLASVVDVDWSNQETLVAATGSSLPVVRVSVDGLRLDSFNSSNLTPPVRVITAAPSRSIVVADSGGLWTASDIGEVWRPHPRSPWEQASPFYPG
jgi:hypothetical protein